MSAIKNTGLTSEEAYLQWELTSEVKHELIDGQIYAMAGASENHARISGNIYAEFRHYLKDKSCEAFISDMKVKTSAGNFSYPDCMVVCGEDNHDHYYKTNPVILVEVLSRATRKTDKKEKLLEYINIQSLLEYVIIEQDYVDIEVLRRSEAWVSTRYFLGDSITFESIDLTIPVEDIYHRVQNEDMMEFLNNKAE
jgi:Uma2 family endonuclease